jgi:hypothetical protein
MIRIQDGAFIDALRDDPSRFEGVLALPFLYKDCHGTDLFPARTTFGAIVPSL